MNEDKINLIKDLNISIRVFITETEISLKLKEISNLEKTISDAKDSFSQFLDIKLKLKQLNEILSTESRNVDGLILRKIEERINLIEGSIALIGLDNEISNLKFKSVKDLRIIYKNSKNRDIESNYFVQFLFYFRA